MPVELPEEDSRDLLAYASFRIFPAYMSSPATPQEMERDRQKANSILNDLMDGPLAVELERRFVERLMPAVSVPLQVKVFPRRAFIELGVLILGSYALLKDYKPLRACYELD